MGSNLHLVHKMFTQLYLWSKYFAQRKGNGFKVQRPSQSAAPIVDSGCVWMVSPICEPIINFHYISKHLLRRYLGVPKHTPKQSNPRRYHWISRVYALRTPHKSRPSLCLQRNSLRHQPRKGLQTKTAGKVIWTAAFKRREVVNLNFDIENNRYSFRSYTLHLVDHGISSWLGCFMNDPLNPPKNSEH